MGETNKSAIRTDAKETADSWAPPRFPRYPFYAALGVWMVAVLPVAYDPGSLIFPITLVPALVILPIAALAWLFYFGRSLIYPQPQHTLSLVLAAAAFASAVPLTFYYMGEIRFWTLSPYYFAEIARLQPDSNGVRKATFRWRGGLGLDVTLQYDEADSIAPKPGEATLTWDDGGYHHSVSRMYGHFFLDNVDF